MGQISAADVGKLRKSTGAGMMDCKKALQEADGDFDKAVEIIRKKGQAIANKRADRDATEGCALAKANGANSLGAVVVLNCETDFVAKNEDFVKLTSEILDLAIENNPSSLDELKALSFKNSTVGDVIVEQTGIIGEKLDLSVFEKVEAEDIITYIHPGNKLATIAGFNKKVSDVQVAKDVAMQIAAMNPVALDKDSVPEDVISKEIEIGKEQAKQEGKPEAMLEKIAMGKLNKFFKENTLLNQPFTKDNKLSIKQYLEGHDKDLTVTDFKRCALS